MVGILWCVMHAAAAEEASILSRNDFVVLVIVFEVLFLIVGLTESSFLGMMYLIPFVAN